MMKKGLFLIAFMTISSNVFAQTLETPVAVETGTCGAECTWTFYDNGLLDISGSGDMDNYNQYGTNEGTDKWNESPWYQYRKDITNINISGITSIGDYAFGQIRNVSTVDIPPTVTKIGAAVFYRSGFESIDIPETVTSINWNDMFSQADKLTHVTIPNSTETIGAWFFGATSSLKELVLPENLKTIGTYSLIETAMETLVVPASVKTIFQGAFSDSEKYYAKKLKQLYCTSAQMAQCETALIINESTFKPTHYEKSGNDYLVYDDKGNVVGKYADMTALSKGSATERYKYDPAGHLVGIFDGNGQRTWGKKIYTVEEAMEATKNGDKFHVKLTYK